MNVRHYLFQAATETVVLLFASAAFCATSPVVSDLLRGTADVRELSADHAATLHVLQSDEASGRPGLTFCWAVFTKKQARIQVTDVRKQGELAEIYEHVTAAGDLAIINGGFYMLDSRQEPVPQGLVISNGVVRNKQWPWQSGGVLRITSTELDIVPIRRFKNSRAIRGAIQGKPILVEAGRNGIRSDSNDPRNRSAIGVTTEGDVFVAGVYTPDDRAMSLYEFGQLLALPRSAGGVGVRDALAMDGGSEAHIYFPGIKRHFGVRNVKYVPEVVRFSIAP